ncbi:MAG: hypothetical protein UW70_C0044G0031 [Candidatus Peregrinibacteria bacterium GW2011_GWA2_44_7]|nr:MAG: hypothetical protein UW70_C0044G0031 [Candidatus Peregrinibacteria bacterium GW2011_GWA2_44_7]
MYATSSGVSCLSTERSVASLEGKAGTPFSGGSLSSGPFTTLERSKPASIPCRTHST